MKNILVMFFLIFSISIYSQNKDTNFVELKNHLSYRDTNYHMYYVEEIYKIQNGYDIVLCRKINEEIRCFDVLSTKYGKHIKGVRIRKKRYYCLKIFIEYDNGYEIINCGSYGVVRANIHGKIVETLPEMPINQAYTSPNLNGLKYIPDSGERKKRYHHRNLPTPQQPNTKIRTDILKKAKLKTPPSSRLRLQ